MYKKSTRAIGRIGELIAAKYLESLSYTVLTKNWNCRYGEVDILAKDERSLVFVEVKYVQSNRFCDAVDLFSTRKRENLLRTILYFLHSKGLDRVKWRLDLVCITKDEGRYWIEHYKNALSL